MPVELQPKLSARTPQHIRFVVEALLVILLLMGLWVAVQPKSLYIFVDAGGFRSPIAFQLYLLAIVGFVFLSMVYYGTSFEVTPLKLILRPIGNFAKIRELTPSNSSQISVSGSLSEKKNNMQVDYESIETEDMGTELFEDISEDAAGPADTVARILRRSSHSASHLARKMERRINTHLILGVLVGLVGLVIWYYSFFITPGSTHNSTGGTSSISSADRTGSSEPTNAVPTKTGSAVMVAWDLIPRITILLFIELLAGFFLRQYRIGVEDFKYFLELQRRAEASRIAYAIFDQLGDTESKRKFATTLLEARSDFRLQKDETTTMLETMKSEENTTLKLISVLGEHLESVTKLLRKDKEK